MAGPFYLVTAILNLAFRIGYFLYPSACNNSYLFFKIRINAKTYLIFTYFILYDKIMKNIEKPLIAPSILSADFCTMGEEVRKIEDSGADWIHIDVMDGHFVPNLTFGPKMVSDIRKITSLPLDVHLMVDKPGSMIDDFVTAGADYITIHFESTVHIDGILRNIKNAGCKAGISLVPSTPIDHISEILEITDLILIMTVNPGFGGQSMITKSLDKVEVLNKLRKKNSYEYLIAVDGGINAETAFHVRKAGSDIMVSGSAFFKADNSKQYIKFLKGID